MQPTTPYSGLGTWRGSVNDFVEERPVLSRISDRLSDLFGRRKSSQASYGFPTSTRGEEDAPIYQSSTASGPYHLQKMPNIQASVNEPPLLEVSTEPTAAPTAESANINPVSFQPKKSLVATEDQGKIKAHLLGKVGNEQDYSRITGQIEIVNGAYMVHYAIPGNTDRFGGRMILNGSLDLTGFQNGDLVTVHGSVLEGRTISLYRADTIEMVEPATK